MLRNEFAKQAKRYLQITLGALIVCLGFNLFIIPAHLLTGGLSGIALIIYYLTDLPVGMQNIVYNLPILYLAYRVFGRLYAWDTVVGTVVLSIILDATHFMVDWNVTQDGMLNAIFGGVMAGIGFGIIFRSNANTGGLDVLGAVAKKASAWMFNMDEALYTLVSIYVTAELTNRVAAGLNREKSIFIVSPAAEQICQEIMENVHRGVTYLEGKGGFAREHKEVLFIVVRLTQVSRVKAIVDHYDPQAFMIVSDTSEVSGKGFTLACETYQDARARWLEEQERQKEIESGQL